MATDWIKLHRSMLESPIFQHDGLFRLWSYCLLRAAWKPGKWLIPNTFTEIDVPRGAFITGRQSLHSSLYPLTGRDGNLIKREYAPAPITLWRWLQSLEKIGCVNIENVNNQCSMVTVCNYSTYQDRKSSDDQPVNNQRSASDQPVITVEEGKKERRKEGKPKKAAEPLVDAIPESLQVPEFELAWREWHQYRAERGEKALTQTGLNRLLSQLAGWGSRRSIVAIHHSIANGWRGIFEPKGDCGNGRSANGKSGEQTRFNASIDALARFADSDEATICEGDGAPLRLEADDGLF